jgi:hypothetical protein
MLKDDDPEARGVAIAMVGRIGGAEALPAILGRLKDKDEKPFPRSEAARALGRRRDRSAISDLEKMAETGEERERMAAMLTLARLGSKESVPKMIANFTHTSVFVRQMAVASLGVIGAKDRIADIARMLKDDDGEVRAQAARALERLEGRNALPRILPLLEDQAGSTTEGVVWALVRLQAWEAKPQVLPLLERRDRSTRRAVCTFLAHAGGVEGVPLMLEDSWGNLAALNALRRPEEWKRLRAMNVPANLKGTVLQVIESIAKEAGLKVELVPDPVLDGDKWFHFPDDAEDRMSPLSVAIALEDVVPWTYAAILEEDHVRLVLREEARRFWRDWWKEFSSVPSKK